MRTEFCAQLDTLTADLGTMCDLAGAAMQRATRALLTLDMSAADLVKADMDQIRRWNNGLQRRAVSLLATQAPVAGDLRAVVASLQIAADVDRMGGLARHVARSAWRRFPAATVPDELTGHFTEMGRKAVELASGASTVILTGDPVGAKGIRDGDKVMNDLHRDLFAVVQRPGWTHGVETATDVVLLGRFYERFADHAVEIARRVVFRTAGVGYHWSLEAAG